jgi:hypothetical protein
LISVETRGLAAIVCVSRPDFLILPLLFMFTGRQPVDWFTKKSDRFADISLCVFRSVTRVVRQHNGSEKKTINSVQIWEWEACVNEKEKEAVGVLCIWYEVERNRKP